MDTRALWARKGSCVTPCPYLKGAKVRPNGKNKKG